MRGAQALGKYLEISRRKEVNVLGSPLSGRRATGIGRERASKGLLLGRGPYLATPASGCHFDHVIFVRVAGYMVNTFVYF